MASRMAIAKPNIRKFLFFSMLPQSNAVWAKIHASGAKKRYVKYWIYRCYGNYNNAIIKSERGRKIGKLPQIARTRFIALFFSRHMLMSTVYWIT